MLWHLFSCVTNHSQYNNIFFYFDNTFILPQLLHDSNADKCLLEWVWEMREGQQNKDAKDQKTLWFMQQNMLDTMKSHILSRQHLENLAIYLFLVTCYNWKFA